MATTRVQLPDGNIGEFPASMKPEEIEAVLAKQFPPESAAPGVPKAPTPKMEESTLGKVYGSFHPEGGPAIERWLAPTMHDSSQGVMSNIGTGLGNIAKGAGHILTHPEELVTGAVNSLPPVAFAKSVRDAYKHTQGQPNETDERIAHPMENLEYAAGQMAPFALAGGAEALPSKARAIANLGEVAKAAKDVPVSMAKTEPAVGEFKQYVSTGGRGTPVVNKLVKRMAAEEPINFPEARQFYTNVSRATARPGFLRRAIEAPSMPDMRRNLGNVRVAMADDLTNAAESVGQGDRYTQAVREYGRAAKLNRVGKIGATLATEEALRRSGLLGKMAAGAANMAGR